MEFLFLTWKDIRDMAIALVSQIKGIDPAKHRGHLTLDIYDLHIDIYQDGPNKHKFQVEVSFMGAPVFCIRQKGIFRREIDYHYGSWAILLREIYAKREIFAEVSRLCREWHQYSGENIATAEIAIRVSPVTHAIKIFWTNWDIAYPVTDLVYSESDYTLKSPSKWLPTLRLLIEYAKNQQYQEQEYDARRAEMERDVLASKHIAHVRQIY